MYNTIDLFSMWRRLNAFYSCYTAADKQLMAAVFKCFSADSMKHTEDTLKSIISCLIPSV